MGRQARGVKAISLREGDCVVGMCVVTNDDLILTASETGFGRISNVSDYRLQSRGGKGITNYHTEKYGNVAAVSVVELTDDIIIISQEGVIIRIAADTVRICNRPSKGVTLMRIGENDKVVTVARAPHEDSSKEETSEEVSEDNTAEMSKEENTEE